MSAAARQKLYAERRANGLALAFEFEQFVFQHRGVDIDTLIPQRLFEYWPVQTPDRRAQNAPLGSRQKLMMRVLKKLAGQRPNGVERDLLRSHFMQELIAEHKRQHNTQLSSDHARVAFGQTLDSLKNRGLIEGEDLLFPTDGTRQPQAYERNVPPKGENVRSYVDPDAAERSVRNRTKRTNRSDGQGEGSEGMGEGNANASPRSDGLEEKLARMRARDVPPS